MIDQWINKTCQKSGLGQLLVGHLFIWTLARADSHSEQLSGLDMHQCQSTGSQSDWVKLRVLAETPMDSRSMKRKQHSMSDPVGTGGYPVPTGSDIECCLRFIEQQSIGPIARK